MMWRTHQLFGFIAAVETMVYLHEPILSLSSAAAAIGGMLVAPLPDVDEPNSVPAKSAFPLAWACELLRIRHRTVTHSILFMWLLYWFVQAFPTHGAFGLNWYVIGVGMLAGYASHPVIDLLNPGGVMLFWPLPMKVGILPEPLAIPVDSAREEMVKMVLGVAGYAAVGHWFYATVPQVQQVVNEVLNMIHKLIS